MFIEIYLITLNKTISQLPLCSPSSDRFIIIAIPTYQLIIDVYIDISIKDKKSIKTAEFPMHSKTRQEGQ